MVKEKNSEQTELVPSVSAETPSTEQTSAAEEMPTIFYDVKEDIIIEPIWVKLWKLRSAIDVFTKDTTGYKYKYVSGTQILGKIQSMMNELKVMLYPYIPKVNERVLIDVADKDGVMHTEFIESGDMVYRWQNVEDRNDYVDICWHYVGQQNDPSKAFGSGLTYSERYFLLKFFNIPTDELDPDKNQDEKGSMKKAEEDVRPWLSEKQLTTAIQRIYAGEEEIYDKIVKSFRMKKAYREQLDEAKKDLFNQAMK